MKKQFDRYSYSPYMHDSCNSYTQTKCEDTKPCTNKYAKLEGYKSTCLKKSYDSYSPQSTYSYESDFNCFNNSNNYSNCNDNCNDCNNCDLYDYKVMSETTTITSGNSIEFQIREHDCEIKADINAKAEKVTIISGEVFDRCSIPAEGVMVTLVEPAVIRGYMQYIQVACTITDSLGYFQFYMPYSNKETEYHIVLGQKIIL